VRQVSDQEISLARWPPADGVNAVSLGHPANLRPPSPHQVLTGHVQPSLHWRPPPGQPTKAYRTEAGRSIPLFSPDDRGSAPLFFWIVGESERNFDTVLAKRCQANECRLKRASWVLCRGHRRD